MSETLADGVATAVAELLVGMHELERDEIEAMLPTHIRLCRPSKKIITRAVIAAGWRMAKGRHGELLFRAPQAQFDPMARSGALGDNIAGEQLRLLIERIERLEEEKKGIADDIKDVFAEAKSTGFDVKTVRAVIKLRGMEKHHRDEAEVLLDLYKSALGMA